MRNHQLIQNGGVGPIDAASRQIQINPGRKTEVGGDQVFSGITANRLSLNLVVAVVGPIKQLMGGVIGDSTNLPHAERQQFDVGSIQISTPDRIGTAIGPDELRQLCGTQRRTERKGTEQ